MKINNALSIIPGNGVFVTTGASSAEEALPAPSHGPLRYVAVTCRTNAFIRFGFIGGTCTSADFMLNNGQVYLFMVSGQTHFQHIRKFSNVVLSVYALENG